MNNSLTEPPFIPAWAKDFEDTIFFIYNGPSMGPLFKPGDLLCVRKFALENVRLGDIVIIHRKSDKSRLEHVVHRVVSVKPGYLITQGDNNLKPDPQAVTSDNLVGLVTSFGCQNHVYSVRGGILGLFYARLIFTRNLIWQLIKRLGWRAYNWIRKSGLFARVWRPMITKIYLTTDNGPLIKYCHGNRTVAVWDSARRHFDCRKPFDLVIPNPEESK